MKKQSAPVAEQRLYQLVRQKNPIVDRTFSIEFLDAVVWHSRSRSADSSMMMYEEIF